MDYELKGNVTTVVTFILMPLLAGVGVDSITASALAGVIATLLCYLVMYLNERYLSGIFTKAGYQVVKEPVDDTTPESAINPEYVDEGA